VFPLRGVFSYGQDDAKFGAKRNGHTHQGQDLLAAEGIPVVAPRSGTIEYVEYQKGGAGWYVILDGDGENFDYAFMHLVEGSIPVHKGEHVDQGQRLGSVGHTGDAQGDHLHLRDLGRPLVQRRPPDRPAALPAAVAAVVSGSRYLTSVSLK
jgi:murein DD-endopeptidase MepM/ murein hydrolase activator NlpD